MNLKTMDFLSPQITLFFFEHRAHTSKIGGFLVISMLSLSFLYISYLVYLVLSHKKETSVYFRRFESEIGQYSFNSSSIFHFIQFFSPESGGYFDEYNPKHIYIYITFVHSRFKESNLGLYDHWVFDRCRKDIDDANVDKSLLANVDNFTNSACIRYYYNSKIRQYFPLGSKEFIWPYLEHGTASRNNVYLTTIVQKCNNDSVINNIFGKCPSQEEIDDYINKFIAIYLYFTDTQIDPLNYKNPIQSYLNTIISGIGTKQTFVENYIYFSPVQVRTKEGDLFTKTYNENSFYFDMNRKGAASNSEEYYKLVKYYHLMQNSIQIYERRYNNIFDILPQIGGVTQFLFYIFFWLNYFYNKYIIAYDTNSLFFNVKETKRKSSERIIDNIKKAGNNNNDNNIINNNNYADSNNININDINNLNNKIYNFHSINKNNNNSLDENLKVNNVRQYYLRNNIKTFIDNKRSNFSKLSDIKEEQSKSSLNLNLFNEHNNDKSNNSLIHNENSILNKKIINNTINVIKKESKKNSLFNIFESQKDICQFEQFKTMNKLRITKAGLKKLTYTKDICKNLIKEDRMKVVKRLSFILYIKSHFLSKYKGSADFIIRFRRNLLSEEHLFKSHLKNSLLFKQYHLSNENYISFIDCFNNL